MTSDAVRAYYASLSEREWTRLENPDDGAVEFAITCHTLATYLPPDARVLDIGGGPGRYAIWLAQRGHRVVLADLSPELLSIAQAKIEQAGVGTMVALLAAEGIVIDIQRALFELAEGDPVAYEAAFEVVIRTANDPCILGMARHLLYVGCNSR